MRILLIVVVCIISYFTLTERDYRYDTSSIKVSYDDLLPTTKRQVDCLAANIYFEAGHEPENGKIAVGMVTLNRVHSYKWPRTVCGVVKEKDSNVCQFSWWCEPRNKEKAIKAKYTRQEKLIYNKAKEIALYVYMNYEDLKDDDLTDGAQFYHADYVNPGWKLKRTTKIGRHIFYKQM
jgi:spore germination cell wall hydrolase CwlJ-like protein